MSQEYRSRPALTLALFLTVKAEAVRAALRGGFVTSLVTHGALARALLEP